MKFTINLLKVFTILTITFLISCTKTSTVKTNPFLFNCWTDSYEESENKESTIYRSCDYKVFDSSHYRNSFTLREDLTLDYLVLSPVDAHFFIEGTWELNESMDVITLFSNDDKVLAKYKIVEIEEDMLSLKRL